MSLKTLAIILIVAGGLLALVAGLGHLVGLLHPGFGLKQLAGTVVGVVILIVGIVLYLRASRA